MFDFLPLGPSHLEALLALEGEVISGLERPDLLRRNSPEMWQSCLLPPHVAFGAEAGGLLVAVAVLYVPQPGDGEGLSHLLQGVGREGHEGLRSANYKICLVRRGCRGHGLQQRLGRLLEAAAAERGIGLLCSTVSPHNPASLRSLERLGYRPNRALVKYGFERILMYKYLNGCGSEEVCCCKGGM